MKQIFIFACVLVLILVLGCSQRIDDDVIKEAINAHIKTLLHENKTRVIKQLEGLVIDVKVNSYNVKDYFQKTVNGYKTVYLTYECDVMFVRKDKNVNERFSGKIEFTINEIRYKFDGAPKACK